MKSLLIVRPDNIGDFLIFSGTLKYYAQLYSNYSIDIVCKDSVVDLASNCPHISTIIPYSPNIWIRKHYFQRYIFIKKLRKKEYDIMIYPVFSRALDHERINKNVRAKEKIAFDGNFTNDSGGKRFSLNNIYTKIIKSSEKELIELERNMEFLYKLGFNDKIGELNSKIWLSNIDIESATNIINKNNLKDNHFIIISPGATSKTRIWDKKKWIEVSKYLLDTTNYQLILIGNKNDKQLLDDIFNDLKKYHERIINLCNKTTLINLSALTKKARLFIGSESGPIHIAAALKVPNICIMGGGHFGRFYPYGNLNNNQIVYKKMDCFGCNWYCRYNTIKCINSVEPRDVIKKLDYLLNTN